MMHAVGIYEHVLIQVGAFRQFLSQPLSYIGTKQLKPNTHTHIQTAHTNTQKAIPSATICVLCEPWSNRVQAIATHVVG